MFTRIIAPAVVCLLVFQTSRPANAEFIIDNFSAGAVISQFSAGSTTQTTVDASILGGSRETTLNLPALGGAEFFGLVGFGPGLQMAQGVSDQINGSFLYDDFGSIDLTEGGSNFGFELELLASDSVAPITNAFSIRITSGGASSIVTFDLPGNSDVPSNVRVNFAEFGGIDLANIDSIELLFDTASAPGTDLFIGGFSVIPEPASGFMVLVLTGLVYRRRRS